MLTKIKSRVQQSMRFAKKHPTLVAVAATAAVTHKYTYTRTLNGALVGCSSVLYAAGRDNGVLEMQNIVLRDFIGAQGLNEELKSYILGLKA